MFCSTPMNISQKSVLWDSLDIASWRSTSPQDAHKDRIYIPPPWASLIESRSVRPRATLSHSKKILIENQIEEEDSFQYWKIHCRIYFIQWGCLMHLATYCWLLARRHSWAATRVGQRNQLKSRDPPPFWQSLHSTSTKQSYNPKRPKYLDFFKWGRIW